MLRFSIIVPTYNRSAYLRDVIHSLQNQNTPSHHYEIIVVDNSSGDETPQIVREIAYKDSRVRYLREERVGLHFARHTGAKNAEGDILVYVDDDIITDSNWLSELTRPYEDETVACVGGKVLPRWESIPPSWISSVRPCYFSLLDWGDGIKELKWPQDIYGCNFSIRKSILFKAGGFNPDAFGERQLIWYRGDGETGLLRKIHALGYKVFYNSRALVRHRIPASRLTVEYIKRRAYDGGISSLYSIVHNKRHIFSTVSLTLPRTILSLYYHWIKLTSLPRNAEGGWIKEAINVSSKTGKISYAIRLLFSSRLRRYVLKWNYLK
jgi:glycosyltransferase involved in cell wall biosynthesis